MSKLLMKNIMFGFIFASASQLFASQVTVLPPLLIEGLGNSKKVMVFAVNSRAPVISNGAMSYVRWVNGQSQVVSTVRGQAEVASFDYVVSNSNIIQFKTNHLVIVEFSEKVLAPYYLNRHITDSSCPQTPRSEDLDYFVNEGCVSGQMSELMNAIVSTVPLSRIHNDPNASNGKSVVLKKGRDF